MIRVAMVVYSQYPSDPRVRREAEALRDGGLLVDVICLRGPNDHRKQMVRGVSVYRLDVGRTRAGHAEYVLEYLHFLVVAARKLWSLHMRWRYAVVHVHNMPDVLVWAALPVKAMGAKVVLDLHDPMPEVYMTKYRLGPNHMAVRVLRWLERRCIRSADLVLTPNKAFSDVFVSRSCPHEKIEIVMNSPQEEVFGWLEHAGRVRLVADSAHFRVMYHGSIVARHGLLQALKAIAVLRRIIPELVFDVYGDGDYVVRFQRDIVLLGLADRVRFHGPVSLEEIASRIPTADVGVIPNLRTPFTEINLPTRILEYLSAGVPVIAPRTRGISDYFDDAELFFFEPGDVDDLARVIYRVYSEPEAVKSVVQKGRLRYKEYGWRLQAGRLLSRYRELLGTTSM